MNIVIKNNFAPKCQELFNNNNSHGVFCGICNFHCKFCGRLNNQDKHNDITQKLKDVSLYGLKYKFTGGEPTLDKQLEQYLKIVKEDLQGIVFLDTNGSQPLIIEKLLKNNLIDVLGISLKGVTLEEASLISGVNSNLCWENTLKSINLGLKYNTKIIVTLVFYNGQDILERLENFYNLFSFSSNIYYKINNLMITKKSIQNNLFPLDENELQKNILIWINRHPEISGRIIYIPNNKAVQNFNEIQFL